MALAATIISVHVLTWYRGLPLEGFPEETVTILLVKVEKPNILIIAQRDDEDIPRYWLVPYSRDAAVAVQQALNNGKATQRGKFKKIDVDWMEDGQMTIFEKQNKPYKDDK